jgi:hypothetical protein
MTKDELITSLTAIFPSGTWPKPLHALQALQRIQSGTPLKEAAMAVGTSASNVSGLAEDPDPIRKILGLGLQEVDAEHRSRALQILGQLLLGRCAEMAFLKIFKTEMQKEEFEIRDLREGRTDTDYRLHNGRGRPVYRINIKFHGSRFRRAPEMVGLEAEDCFALATYKIHSALLKQQEESLPYFFAIVGVSNLTGEVVGRDIPSHLVETVALIDQAPKGKSKRDFEDAVVESLVASDHPVFLQTYQRIVGVDWFIISARRAEKLLRELLFDRVFALRVRNFTRAFRGAELDMHFSLSKDLIPFRKFLETLRTDGPQRITTLLERGEY